MRRTKRYRQPSGPPRLTRRQALALGSLALASAVADTPATPPPTTGLGLVIYDCAFRRRWLSQRDPQVDLFEPLAFLRHCHQLGAGGMQVPLGVLDATRVRALRDYAGENKLFIDGMVSPPRDRSDLDRFEAEIRTAAEVGVQAVRTVVMPGRRYEQFTSWAAFREAAAKAQQMLEWSAPILARHRVRLAVENHKDQRIDERVALYRRLQCEYIGATVDTGNSFALLDDPYGAIEALAPYAFAVHLKDQALREYEQGFLLGDIPLGEGSFDVKRIVALLQSAKPDLRMVLELLTRDALKVTCLTDKYWAAMPDVAGHDLARTLRFVREHPTPKLQEVSSLSLDKQVALEDANIAASLRYAAEQLKL